MSIHQGSNEIGKLFVGSNQISKVYKGDVLVYSANPDALYNAGDQVQDITGGWSKHKTLMTNSTHITGWPYGPNGTVTFNSTNVKLAYGGSYGGVMINTANAINFANENIKSLTINCSTTIGGWGYEDSKWSAGLTYATWVIALVPTIADEQAYTKVYAHDYGNNYIDGTSSTTKTESFQKTLNNLNSLTGSYYIVVGLYRSTPGEFSMTVNSITCEGT